MLSFHLVASPARLDVDRVGWGVFRLMVSCQVVADSIAVRGVLQTGSAILHIHSSLAAACRAAKRAEAEGADHTDVGLRLNGAPTALTAQRPLRTPTCLQLLRPSPQDNPEAATGSRGLMREISEDFGASSGGTVMLPQGGTRRCRPGTGHAPPALTPVGAVTAPPPLSSYLQALLTPSRPSKPSPSRPALITTSVVCFCCLAADHLVRDCRDPVCCHNCRGTGHRTNRCRMSIARVLTPFPRRRATVTNPTAHASVHAVPFSPPLPTSAPPTPAHLAPTFAAAFDACNKILSSSSVEVDFQLPCAGFSPVSLLKVGTPFPRKASRPASPASRKEPLPHVFLRAVDLHIVSPWVMVSAAPSLSPVEDDGASGSRSPPHADSAPPPALQAPSSAEVGTTTADSDASEEFLPDSLASDEEEVESSAGSDLADWDGSTQSLEVWLPRGQVAVAARLAFAIVTPAEVCANVAPFIRSALSSVLPDVQVELLPSWRGAMLPRFVTPADRELARHASPIAFQGGNSCSSTRKKPQTTSFACRTGWLKWR